MLPTWVAKSASWYMNDPLQNAKFDIWMGWFSWKLWKNRVIWLKIWCKIGSIDIWTGQFFLKNWYLYGSTFKFCGSTSLPKPKLSTPRLCTALRRSITSDNVTHSTCMPSRGQAGQNVQNQISIAIFWFSMKTALKWVQTSLVLVQWFLR